MKQVTDIVVQGAVSPLAARLYSNGWADALMVFLHSGGFCGGDLEDADRFLQLLARAAPNLSVLAANYTLASKSPFPAAVDDAYAVLEWAVAHATELAWSGRRLHVAGIEAGANLAAGAALIARDRSGPALAGQVLITPMLDPSLSSRSMRATEDDGAGTLRMAQALEAGYKDYLPRAADRFHPYASPLHTSRLRQLPPALILSAENDPLMDEAEQYGARLIAAGVPTRVLRLPPIPRFDESARNDCACRAMAVEEVANFAGGGMRWHE